jgi:hypothetical protein
MRCNIASMELIKHEYKCVSKVLNEFHAKISHTAQLFSRAHENRWRLDANNMDRYFIDRDHVTM